jgi:hypothetical protein
VQARIPAGWEARRLANQRDSRPAGWQAGRSAGGQASGLAGDRAGNPAGCRQAGCQASTLSRYQAGYKATSLEAQHVPERHQAGRLEARRMDGQGAGRSGARQANRLQSRRLVGTPASWQSGSPAGCQASSLAFQKAVRRTGWPCRRHADK